jgi:hypothetical protein
MVDAHVAGGAGGDIQAGRVTWELEYTAQGAYGLTRLSAQDWHGVADRLAAEPALFERFYTYKEKGNPSGSTCTGTCVTNQICRLRTSWVGQPACA